MYILDEENRAIDLNLIPDECDIHFWVYDAAKDIRDYHVAPLIMLESFYSPIVKLKFTEDTNRNPREYSMNIPAEYQLLIGDPTYGELELVPVTSLSKRGFMTFENNPLSSFRVKYLHVDVSDILPNVKWFMPKIQIIY